MEQKPASSNKNLTPYIAIGGIGLAIFGASYYIWKRIANKRKPGSKGKRLPKDLVIKILITTKRELFPLWNTLAGECKGFLDANNLRIVPHKVKMIFLQKGQLFSYNFMQYNLFWVIRTTIHIYHHKESASRIQGGS